MEKTATLEKEILVLEDNLEWADSIEDSLIKVLDKKEISFSGRPKIIMLDTLKKFKQHISCNHKTRSLIYDRNLEEPYATRPEKLEGDQAVELLRSSSPSSKIYSFSFWDYDELDVKPERVKVFKKKLENLNELVEECVTEILSNNQIEIIPIGQELILTDYIKSKIDKITDKYVVLECYTSNGIEYLEYDRDGFSHIPENKITLGSNYVIRILKDELGNRITNIIEMNEKFGFPDWLLERDFYKNIPDFSDDDLLNSEAFGKE